MLKFIMMTITLTMIPSNLMINMSIMSYMLIMMSLSFNEKFKLVISNSMMMMDPLSTMMILLTMMSILLILLASNNLLKFHFLMTTIMVTLSLTFITSNMLMFYIMFEMTLIPTLFLITKLGPQPERLQAMIYLLFYTLLASLPLLVSIIWMKNNSMIFMTIMNMKFNNYLPLMLAFLVKLPMFMMHLWLPKAHVEAPMEGSMILAAILLKLGGYGLIRFFPIINHKLMNVSPWLISISLMGAIISSMMCTQQKDMKALIAYSSVAHMNLSLASMIIYSQSSMKGAIIMMIGHAMSSSALFMLVNITYSKFHTRNIISIKGIFNSHPNLTFWWFMFTALNIAAPPSINLISEILMMMSLINWNISLFLPMIMMSLLSATFSILLFSNLIHNKSETKNMPSMKLKYYINMFIHMYIPLMMITKMEMMLI